MYLREISLHEQELGKTIYRRGHFVRKIGRTSAGRRVAEISKRVEGL